VVGDELGELFFQQFILGLEARDEAEDLFQYLAQGQVAVHGGGFAQLVEGIVLLSLVEDLVVDVVDNVVPLPGLDGLRDGLVVAHGLPELLEEHAVDLHPLVADGCFLDHRENIRPQVLVRASRHDWTDPAVGVGALA